MPKYNLIDIILNLMLSCHKIIMKNNFNLKYFNQSCRLPQQKVQEPGRFPQRLEMGSVCKQDASSVPLLLTSIYPHAASSSMK